LLVATDIAARGIDIDSLAYVVHFQMAEKKEYYTHRSGRTARAGKKEFRYASYLLPKWNKYEISKKG